MKKASRLYEVYGCDIIDLAQFLNKDNQKIPQSEVTQSHVCLITDVKMMLMKKTVKDVNDDDTKHEDEILTPLR